jgi:hypothetical protein
VARNSGRHGTSDINNQLPIIPHETLGADCCGCLYVRVHGERAEIVCNECAAVIRSVRLSDVERAARELAPTDTICSAVCPHCGAVNTFQGMTVIDAFVCFECGEGVSVPQRVQ